LDQHGKLVVSLPFTALSANHNAIADMGKFRKRQQAMEKPLRKG
jgi:hypothetical protein